MKHPPAPNLPGALCAGNHPGLPPEAWLPWRRDETADQAARSCLVLCRALEACRMWRDHHQPTAGIWAGELIALTDPPPPWTCDHCRRRNNPAERDCPWCGRDNATTSPKEGRA